MFKRKIYDDILSWKREANGASALLIEGARRIGKSTIVQEFAKNEYKDFILIDFYIAGNDIKNNFDNIGDLNTFFRNLFILVGKTLPEREGLIIFDEVQFFSKARQAIKHLVKDGRFDYIETGSLISIRKNVKDILIPSEEEIIKMFPMDFEEFLWANGNNIYADAIRDAFEQYADRTTFKMFMGDTGLLVTYLLQSGKETIDKLYKALIIDNFDVNQGYIFENMVAQMLRALGYDLFYHEFKYTAEDNKSEKRYEVDFLTVKGKRLVPMEVKSSGYKSHKSFDYFIKKYQLKVNERYIIYTKDLSCEENVTYIPIYMTICL